MSRLLLDTHLLIWTLDPAGRLPVVVRDLAIDPRNEILFSTVSIWEIAIKMRLGRADFDVPPGSIAQAALATGFVELPLRWPAAALLADLPLHHRDPFDRIIVAQAMVEDVPVYTADARLTAYSSLVRMV